jgi:dynein heavy chain
VDDVNLPWIEEFGTQNALELLRQVIDHKFVMDRADLSLRKELIDLRFIASMNPTAGSFNISQRLQRFFSTFAILMPSQSDLFTIYSSLLGGHLQSFSSDVQAMCAPVVNAALSLHRAVFNRFLPSATKFVYNWNMRELANVFQNITLVQGPYYPDAKKFVRLYAHECQRVFRDRLVNQADLDAFDELQAKNLKEFFPGDPAVYTEQPLVFTSFAAQPNPAETAYLPLPVGRAGFDMLNKTLVDKLEDYNSENTIMDLVLFLQAIEHVCRISRIIYNPGGNALLVGVGGSGKQSLSRLSAYICKYEVRQLAVTARFTVVDLKEALKDMYRCVCAVLCAWCREGGGGDGGGRGAV